MPERTVQEIYQKKTPIQHILLRPDTYVGSIEIEKSQKWVLPKGDKKLALRQKQVSFTPALYKIFDEVLVNAADNYQRDRKMNLLKVTVSQRQGKISVLNNGKGIPVVLHKEHKVYVPELIFGHLLTGSNYSDDDKKVVGGRNGYGAKLANIFSSKLIVECADGQNRKKFRMEWRKNMTLKGQPEIEDYTGKDFTIVTFYPEFHRFRTENLDDDIYSLMAKRVYDMAGLLHRVKVYFNEEQIAVNSFRDYVKLYFPEENTLPIIFDDAIDTDRWEVVVSLSDGQFKQVSFVNSICTSKGGTHVNYLIDQIVQRIQEKLKKKEKDLNVKPFQIKGHLWLFVNCLIENPAFDSQTKETLTLKQSMFGSECSLSEKMIKDILKTGVVDDIFNEAKAKELSKLTKATAGGKKSRLTGIPKLDDANDAGTRNSDNCTLILTEGDSAKSLAMAGLQVIGRNLYGVFPLKGKLLNVREASNKVLKENDEIQNLIKILGLQIGKNYEDVKSLRYGSVMIMSDQDTDGSHIKGLVINFVHHFWPSLFKMPGFLKQFITPLLKATRGKEVIAFYTVQDYKKWNETIENPSSWKIKYYKGLGTSTDKEAQEYFEQIRRHEIRFSYQGAPDDQAIEMVFSKKNVDKRKEWLNQYDPNNFIIYDRPAIPYREFVDKELIHFSNQDNSRSICSIIDGFKPGQRKIIFSCFKRNLKDEIKVAQLSGYVAEHSAYHHGEMSLTETIVNMAQNYVGANNINLLMPNGQFGSRNQGGKDHASARYIFTTLNKVTRFIFPQPDDHVLTYVEDDGQMVEPQFYMPIIPMGLVNGCQGIGTGWSSFIPNHNPREIIRIIKERLLKGVPFAPIHPWYKGFLGQINLKADQNYQIKGIFQMDSQSNNIHIKELPIGKWTKDFKTFVDELISEGNTVSGMREHHTKNRVHFELELQPAFADANRNNLAYLDKFFKITSSMSTKNMVGFNQQNKLHRYSSSTEIIEQFFPIRLEHYGKRKEYLISRLVREVEILEMKERFILEVVEEKLVIRNVKKAILCQTLLQRGYRRASQFPVIKSNKVASVPQKGQGQPDEEQILDPRDISKEFNYLLGLPLWSLTYEKVAQIVSQKATKAEQLRLLRQLTIGTMWIQDLDALEAELDRYEAHEEEERRKGESKIKGEKGKGPKKAAKKKDKETADPKKKNQRKSIDWDEESEEQRPKKQKPPKKVHETNNKKGLSAEKAPQPSNDLLSRIKARMEASQQAPVSGALPKNEPKKMDSTAASKGANKPSGVSTKNKKRKNPFESDQDSDFDIVKHPDNKSKRTIDSDSD